MQKAKGSKAERELFHQLWNNGWGAVRIAGSGSTTRPSPDILASNASRVIAVECKAIKAKNKYFPVEEIQQLLEFSAAFGAEPWVGVRFDNIGWYFVHADDIPSSKGKSFRVSLDFAQKRGLSFAEFIGKYRQERLEF